LHEAVVLGRRYTGEEAKESKMVDEVCPMSQLEERALAAANKLAGKDGLDRRTVAAIKRDLYRDTLTSLNEPVRFYSRL
jgi:enoyl-CoA hydratase/carnithine racemase